MYERKSRRMRVQAVVMIAVLTLGLVGTAAIAQARTVTDPAWGTVRVWAYVRDTGGVWRTLDREIDIFHGEQVIMMVEARSNRLTNDAAKLVFSGPDGAAITRDHFFWLYGLRVDRVFGSSGDRLEVELGGWPRVKDTNNDDIMRIGIIATKTGQVSQGREPDVLAVADLIGRLLVGDVAKTGAHVPVWVYDITGLQPGVILSQYTNDRGLSVFRGASDADLTNDGVPGVGHWFWFNPAWASSAITLPRGTVRLWDHRGFVGNSFLLSHVTERLRARWPNLHAFGWGDRALSVTVTQT
jgi:hypothetical protein